MSISSEHSFYMNNYSQTNKIDKKMKQYVHRFAQKLKYLKIIVIPKNIFGSVRVVRYGKMRIT